VEDRGYTAGGRGHKTGNDDIRGSVGKFGVGANAITKMTTLKPEKEPKANPEQEYRQNRRRKPEDRIGKNLVGRQRSANSGCGRADVGVGTQRDDPGLVLVARLLNTVLDEGHVLLEPKEVGLVADPVDATDTIAGRPAASGSGTLGAFTLKDTPDACSLLAGDDPPLRLADGLLQGRVDNLEHVPNSDAVWVLRNGDPGVKLRD